VQLSERRYGSFERYFTLPEGIDANKIEATFKNGVKPLQLALYRFIHTSQLELGQAGLCQINVAPHDTPQSSQEGRPDMALTISTSHSEGCPRCGSKLISLEWYEPVTSREVQDLWHCWKCQNEFITVELSDEKPPSVPEITKPFFTSLLME
jgi:hypothetical protein